MRHFLTLQVCLLAAAIHFAAAPILAQAGFGAETAKAVGEHLDSGSKDLAAQIYRQLSPAHAPAAIGNVAVGLWMTGRLQVALHLMGLAVAADPTNTDNQCNYAAMLTMCGGAKQAVPVLESLAKRFPSNPTVLNNLGQAYFIAGEKEKAETALGRVLAIAPTHSQAAATQSEIAESKGDTVSTIALAKQAIQHGVTLDRLNRLRKLRYKLTLDDLKDRRPPDPDPLGLRNFVHPAFPTSAIEENRTRHEWGAFYQAIEARLQTLQERLFAVQPPAAAAAQAQAAYAQLVSGNASAAAAQPLQPMRPFARRAKLMLDLLDKDTAADQRLRRAKQALSDHVAKGRQLVETQYRAEYDELLRKETKQTGAGQANADFCAQFVALADKYLAKWSEGREALFAEYLRQLRLKLSEEIYWKQLLQPRREFEATVIKAQIEWLGAFVSPGIPADGILGVQFNESCLLEKQTPGGGKLANFNDVHCEYHSELNLGIGSIITDCDKTESTLGVGPVKLGLNQDMARGTDLYDSFVNCTVEVTVGHSESAKVGPVSVEVGAEGGVGMVIGRNGVEDVYVMGKVEATIMNVISSGAEARMSLVSGSSSVNIL